ncbi:hypothetical protein HK405_008760 [Cladochytrium tenue]|nr:hypothetical protein HK405_008760 [Cladochytrium tenue]
MPPPSSILLLGATGNLGSRVTAALVARGLTVVVLVRSEDKLRTILHPDLIARLRAVVAGADAHDLSAVERAIQDHACDAVVSCAGNMELPWRTQTLALIVRAVADGAVRVGKARGGPPLRAWFIGGLGSLVYPGTGGEQIHNYMPAWTTNHHRGTDLP